MAERAPQFSRREFITRFGIAAAATFGLGAEVIPGHLPVGFPDTKKYGPNVLKSTFLNPLDAQETYSLWQETRPTYRKDESFRAQLRYRLFAPNIVIGGGDSNMVGGNGEDRETSPLEFFIKEMEREGLDWECVNLAKRGGKIKNVINQFDSEQAYEAFKRKPAKSDVWINVGGNDVTALAAKHDDYDKLARLMNEPFKNTDALINEVNRFIGNLDQFGSDFYSMLDALNQLHGDKIRQIIVQSLPNLGQAKSLTADQYGSEPLRLPLLEPITQDFAQKIAIRVNNRMFEAVRAFSDNTGIPVVGIDTFEINDPFDTDQHFTSLANNNIAKIAANRVQFTSA